MQNYTQLSKEEKIQFWQKHFDCWKDSNSSQKKYCESNSISYWNFKTWYGKLKPATQLPAKIFIKLQSKQFTDGSSGKIDIIIMNGITVRVEESISESNLKKIFSAMRHPHD
jgi:hypothetical protein